MGWEDRDYHREQRPNTGSGVLNWILYGSVPLFTAFNIRVRAHAMLVILMGLILLFGLGFGATVADRVQFVTSIFGIVLLHEFGHCFAARWTGGQANEILMTPLGGLAMTMARRKPWPTFVTVAGGPLVNVAICLICGMVFLALGTSWPLLPNQFVDAYFALHDRGSGFLELARYVFWIHAISYYLLLFNLLPVFPMDGGQLLQSILWKPMGYFKSMVLTLNIGLVGSVLMVMVGIATIGTVGGGWLLTFIGINCFMNCLQTRTIVRNAGPWAFSYEDEPDYGAGGFGGGGGIGVMSPPAKRSKGPGYFARKKAERDAQSETDEQQRVDQILAKVSASGMNSLSRGERNFLKKATENQRKRDDAKRDARRKAMDR